MQEGLYYNYYEPMPRIKPLPMHMHTPAQVPIPMVPSDFETPPGSPTTLGSKYTQGYLRTQVGKRMRVTFLLGTNLIQDRVGVLKEVGISFIVLIDEESKDLVFCDIYSIKFVNIYK